MLKQSDIQSNKSRLFHSTFCAFYYAFPSFHFIIQIVSTSSTPEPRLATDSIQQAGHVLGLFDLQSRMLFVCFPALSAILGRNTNRAACRAK